LSRWLHSLALALILPSILWASAGCQVARSEERADTGAADLPSLRRASVALQDRIRRERAHVDEYNRQLAELGADEKRLYASITSTEETVQRLQGDLDGVLVDLDLIEEELDLTREGRARSAGELERLQRELGVSKQELVAVRAATERAANELAAQQLAQASAEGALEAFAQSSAPPPDALLDLAASLDRALLAAGVPSVGPAAWALMLDRAVRPWAVPPASDR
jgi:chromosome segregation ATPase